MLHPSWAETDKAEITWMQGMPLLYSADEKQGSESFNDQQVAWLIGHLGQFGHKIMAGNQKRNIYTMEHGDGFCVRSAIRTPERKKLVRFAKRPLHFPGFRLVVRADHAADLAPYLDKDGAVDLRALAADPHAKGGFTASRAYPAAIQGAIDSGERAAPMEPMLSTRQLFNLLHDGRVRFGFALPVDLAVVRGSPGDPFKDLVMLPIAGVPAFTDSYVACSNGPLGNAVIDAVDRLFDNEAGWLEFIAPLQPLVPAEDFAAMRN